MGNNSDIEADAVDKLSLLLRRTRKIQPHFSTNDKTIGYDGFIEIFRNSKKTKKELLGMLRVQIKGRTFDRKIISEDIYEFGPIDADELKLYYHGNGVMYFLVINPSSNQHKIYYKYLLPLYIRKLLSEGNGKIKLKKLDRSKIDKFYNYCLYHLEEKNNQSQISNIPIDKPLSDGKFSNDEIIVLRGETDEADIFQVKILSKTNSKNKQIDILTADIDIHKINQVNWFDWSAYTQRAGSPILLPTDIGISRIWISDNAQKLKISKADDNTVFYYGYPIRRIENSIRKLIFFDSLHFELYDKSFSFKYNINDTFGNVLKSVQIIEALCNNNLLINDNKLSIGPIQQYEIDATLKNIRPFKNILELIDIFPSLNKLREYQLTLDELNFLTRLHKEFLYKDLPNYKCTECPRYVRYRIRDVSIILLYIQLNGEYLLLNPFDSQFALKPRVVIIHGDNSETAFFTSLFVTFDKAAWRDSSNLNVNTVISSITTLDLSDENQRDQISDMLLQILAAYDESKNPDLLTLANKIAEQLFPIESMEISVYLNCIQTFYRVQEGKLSSEQMEWLETTLADAQSNKNHLIECAANVLLSKFEEAKQAYDLLSEEEKAQIDGYPIAHLLFRKTACD